MILGPRDAFPAILYKIGSIHLIPVGDHSQVICLYLYFPLFLCAWYRRGAVIMMIWRRGNNDENDSDVQSDHSDMCKWSWSWYGNRVWSTNWSGWNMFGGGAAVLIGFAGTWISITSFADRGFPGWNHPPPPESLFLSCKNNYSRQKGSCHPRKIPQNAGTYLKYPKMQWKDSIIHKAFEGLGGIHMLEFSVSDDWCWLFTVPFGSLWNGFSRVTLATHHFCTGISNPIAAKILEGWGWGSKYLNTAWIIVGTMSQNMDVPPRRFFSTN